MGKEFNVLQMANQAEQLTGETAKPQITYALGAGVTCALAVGLLFFAHIGLDALFEALKPNSQSKQKNSELEAGLLGRALNDPPDKGSPIEGCPYISRSQMATRAHAHASQAADHIEASAGDTIRRYYELQSQELERFGLSRTEQHIATCIMHGETNRDIAEHMHLAESTIKKHVQRILSKTGATSRKELGRIVKAQVEQRLL